MCIEFFDIGLMLWLFSHCEINILFQAIKIVQAPLFCVIAVIQIWIDRVYFKGHRNEAMTRVDQEKYKQNLEADAGCANEMVAQGHEKNDLLIFSVLRKKMQKKIMASLEQQCRPLMASKKLHPRHKMRSILLGQVFQILTLGSSHREENKQGKREVAWE